MTLQEYLTSLRHKTVAVIGIGVSNTPLLRRLLAEGIAVTACDRSSREKLGLWPMSWRPPEPRSIWGRGIWTA